MSVAFTLRRLLLLANYLQIDCVKWHIVTVELIMGLSQLGAHYIVQYCLR